MIAKPKPKPLTEEDIIPSDENDLGLDVAVKEDVLSALAGLKEDLEKEHIKQDVIVSYLTISDTLNFIDKWFNLSSPEGDAPPHAEGGVAVDSVPDCSKKNLPDKSDGTNSAVLESAKARLTHKPKHAGKNTPAFPQGKTKKVKT